jgi:hypothetical protein
MSLAGCDAHIASDYTKKRHVISVRTQHGGEYLLQTRDDVSISYSISHCLFNSFIAGRSSTMVVLFATGNWPIGRRYSFNAARVNAEIIEERILQFEEAEIDTFI